MTDKKGRVQDTTLPEDETPRFVDALEGVSRYLWALAGDVRGILARLGLRRPQDLVGRVDLLQQLVTGNPRTDLVDCRCRSTLPGGWAWPRAGACRACPSITSVLNARILGDARYATQRRGAAAASPTEAEGEGLRLTYEVGNGDCAIGATLSGAVTLGEIACPPGGITLELRGYAGQALHFLASCRASPST